MAADLHQLLSSAGYRFHDVRIYSEATDLLRQAIDSTGGWLPELRLDPGPPVLRLAVDNTR